MFTRRLLALTGASVAALAAMARFAVSGDARPDAAKAFDITKSEAEWKRQLTPEQFHVLRVLREAGPGGLACNSIAERSVSGDPDVTRLLDRL